MTQREMRDIVMVMFWRIIRVEKRANALSRGHQNRIVLSIYEGTAVALRPGQHR